MMLANRSRVTLRISCLARDAIPAAPAIAAPTTATARACLALLVIVGSVSRGFLTFYFAMGVHGTRCGLRLGLFGIRLPDDCLRFYVQDIEAFL
eukprot:9162522-Pyramimonas_sp.AAC.2